MPRWYEYKALARSRGALALELYVVESTPGPDPDAVKQTLAAHLGYQKQVEEEGALVMAGPLSDESGEWMEGAGLIVYRAADLHGARALADADPMHSGGARTYRIRRWLVNEGRLNLDVTLSVQAARFTLPVCAAADPTRAADGTEKQMTGAGNSVAGARAPARRVVPEYGNVAPPRVAPDRVVPEKWDAMLASRLNDLRIEHGCSGNLDVTAHKTISTVQRFGFARITGLATGTDPDVSAAQLGGFAGRLGVIVPQSPRGEVVEHVRDFSDVDEYDDRGYRSTGELSPHSDPPTLILLHCLQPARTGGESHLVNVRAIHDCIGARDAALLDVLYRDFPQWCVAGQYGQPDAGPDVHGRPIFASQSGVLSCVYYRPYTEQSTAASGHPLSSSQSAALDLFDECASAEPLGLRFTLRPGETLVLHNRTVLHARTDYEDHRDPTRRRHLLRIWVDAPTEFPVAPAHELGDLFMARSAG